MPTGSKRNPLQAWPLYPPPVAPLWGGSFIKIKGAVEPVICVHRLISIRDCASLTFHRSPTSNRLFPSEKSADSVVIGYHATYPAPLTALNDGLIWSQLECFAIASGTPTRVRRVVSSGMTPS